MYCQQTQVALPRRGAGPTPRQIPDAEQLLQKMEHEYALLVERMQAYYAVQKQLLQQKKDQLQLKKEQLLQQYNDFDIRAQYSEMKQNWLQQQRQWQSFIQQYA